MPTAALPYLHDIDPILLRIGPVSIHWYALMYIAGAGLAFWLGWRRLQRDPWRGFKPGQMEDLVFWGMLGVVIGGRLGYMLFYGWAQIAANPLNLFKVWEGGMSFHGGLAGVIVAMLLWARKNGHHGFDVLDFLAPLVPIGLGLGRLGNFIGGELWGRRTDAWYGVIFPHALPGGAPPRDELLAQYAAGALNHEARHPSQLYQAGIEGILLFAIVWWVSRKPRPRYVVGGVFALVYGLGRFVVEFVREPDAHMGAVAFGWMSMGQVLSLPLVAIGVWMIGYGLKQRKFVPPVVAEAA